MSAEELLYRRFFRRDDLESAEELGSGRGRRVDVESFDDTRIVAEVCGRDDAPTVVLARLHAHL